MLLFLDGQSHYDSARIAAKYSTVDVTGVTWSITAEGRFGNCIKRTSFTNNQSPGYLGIAPLFTRVGPWVPSVGVGGVIGFAIMVDDLSRVSGDILLQDSILRIMEGSNYHLRLNLNPDGTFSLIRNVGTTQEGGSGPMIIAQSGQGLTNGSWRFVECRWLIAASGGTFDMRVDGTTVISYSGNTRETDPFFNSLGVWSSVRLFQIRSKPQGVFLTLRVCDLYLADLASAASADVHDFLGDGSVVLLMPNGPGDSGGWLSSSGPNWDMVNDRPVPDDGGTTISVGSPGVSDLYNFEDVPGGVIVKGAQLAILARKETTGSAAVAALFQPPGYGPFQGSPQSIVPIDFSRYLLQPQDVHPGTGVRFTSADINDGQFGLIKTI